MPIIDSQVHAYEANTPKRPWHTVPNWPAHVTGDEMVAAMDKVGVDGAIFISAFSMYRYDSSYAVEVQRAIPAGSASSSRRPGRSRGRRCIAEWKRTRQRSASAFSCQGQARAHDPGLDRILRRRQAHFPATPVLG